MMFAKSLAGHDKDVVYLVLDYNDNFVSLTDGKHHPVSKPKKKSRKHVQLIRKLPAYILEEAESYRSMTDERVAHLLKRYEDGV